MEDRAIPWGWHLVAGLIGAGIATALLLQPDATRSVVRLFFGWAFIVFGVVWVVRGFRSPLRVAGAFILIGLGALGVGTFVVTHGPATAVFLATLLGFAVMLRGVLLVARRVLGGGSRSAGVELAEAVVEFGVGLALVLWPDKTFSVVRIGLVVVLYLWAAGEFAIAFVLQRQLRRGVAPEGMPSVAYRPPERA